MPSNRKGVCGTVGPGHERWPESVGDGPAMAGAREVSYEVQVQSEGRWTIDSMHGHKSAALAAAQALVGVNRHDAVRVLEESAGRREKAVFEQECGVRARVQGTG